MLSGGTAALAGTELDTFLQDVRDLISVGLTDNDLGSSVLNRLVFFRSAELDLIRNGLNLMGDDSIMRYEDMLTANANNFRDKAIIAVAYRMAAKVLPALPQIVEESILNERVRYQELDLEERINLLITDSNDIIRPPGESAEGAIFAKADRYVGF